MESKHEYFMKTAIDLAKKGVEANDGGPFGAIVVKDDVVIGQGWNKVTSSNDPTAHAEVVAIRAACTELDSFQLEGCVIYSSCEPCPMCLGAIYWARPKLLIFAGSREDAADAGFDDGFLYEEIGKKVEDRRIETISIMRDSAQAVFRLWKDKTDKISY